jgi:hypothetical protein
MALGFNFAAEGGNDSIIPIVKYDARAGRVSLRDYVDGAYVTKDVTGEFAAIFDMENIETGSIDFSTGGAPSFAVAKFGDRIPAPPTANHKPGFRILIKLGGTLGGTIREFASTAKACLRGIDELHNAYLAGVKTNPGMLPIVKLKSTTPVTTGEGQKKSTNYIPVFEIVGWKPRPADLVYVPKAVTPPPAVGGTVQVPPSTGSTRVDIGMADDFG